MATYRPDKLPNPPFKSTFSKDLVPVIYDPYPDYNSPSWRKRWRGQHVPCNGPRNVSVNGDPEDMIMARQRPLFGRS